MIYGLIIVKTSKTLLVLDYGLSNAIFETPNQGFALECPCDCLSLYCYLWIIFICIMCMCVCVCVCVCLSMFIKFLNMCLQFLESLYFLLYFIIIHILITHL
jgi:hypothetical protein